MTQPSQNEQWLQQELERVKAKLARVEEERDQAVEALKEHRVMAGHQEKMASVGMLAAGVAHEINNPVGYVSSLLGTLDKYTGRVNGRLQEHIRLFELMEDRGVEWPEEAEELIERFRHPKKRKMIEFILQNIPSLIETCRSGTDRIRRIVADLRSFAREDDDKMSEVKLEEILSTSVNISWNELKYKAEVNKNIDTPVMVLGSTTKLVSVFVNLLVNAAQAIEKQGTVSISTSTSDGDVLVEVSDTGVGIPEENLEKVFDPFFTTKPVGQGTGLGLNVVYNIVEQYNGKIWATSQIGEGTTFFVRLPLAS